MSANEKRDVCFDTLSKLCLVLDCAPGDILDYDRDDDDLKSKDEQTAPFLEEAAAVRRLD